MQIIFLFILFISFAHAAPTARKAIVFGGGCEQRENRFVTVMESQIIGLKKNGWEVQTLFATDSIDGGKQELEVASGKPVQNADKQTLLQELDSIIADSRFKKGGSLFISFNTHGNMSPSGGHNLCINKSPLDNLEAVEMNLADSEIIKRLEVLKSMNVKMGFSDMSCYSGESISVLKKFGCIVSSQNKNLTATTYGVAGSLGALLNLPKEQLQSRTLSKKLTLEDVYLDTVLNGQNYKTKDTENSNEKSQHATSSMLEDVSYLGETINSLMTIPHPMVDSEYDNKCFYNDELLTNLNTFIQGLNNPIKTNLLENLTGRKNLDINQLKLDLKNRLMERARIRDAYLNLTNKEREYNLREWSRPQESTISLDPPPEMLTILPYLKDVLTIGFSQEGIKSIQKDDKNININIDVMAIKENKLKNSAKEMANEILPLLENVLKLDPLKTRGKVPSRQELESFLGKMKSETEAYISEENIEKKKAELKQISFLRQENYRQAEQLKKDNPFLAGEKINQISRDFNLLTAIHYFEQRQKWIDSSLPPKAYTDCSSFELN